MKVHVNSKNLEVVFKIYFQTETESNVKVQQTLTMQKSQKDPDHAAQFHGKCFIESRF